MELKKSIIAGMMICIASTLYVAIDNHIVGAILFAFGLLTVFELNLNLFTGKAVDCKQYTFSEMFTFLIGNSIGCAIIGVFVLLSAKSNQLNETAYNLCVNKFSVSTISLYSSAILCGILMAIAVLANRIGTNNISKSFIAIVCVVAFILIGGEHCIADIGYMVLGKYITLTSAIKMAFIIVGNLMGSIIIGGLYGVWNN